MPNPTLGHVECPICGNPRAVVRKEKRGGALYYSCYGGPKGDCGTIQCRYEAGQRFLETHMRPLAPAEQDQAVDEAATEAATEQRETARRERRRRSGLAALAANFSMPEGSPDE